MIVNATDAPGAIEADLLAEISSLYDGFTINGGDNIADLHSGRSGRSAPLLSNTLSVDRVAGEPIKPNGANTIVKLAPDAITHDKPQDKSGNDDTSRAENATSEPKGQELTYAARVSLDHEQMQVDDRLVNLSPGMAVTVEIKTGTRRIISYLLSPLERYTHDSLRER
jgi:hypothetical protein